MEETGGAKLTGIKQIVRLKELLQRWQSVTLNSKAQSAETPEVTFPITNKRVDSARGCDSDDESCNSPKSPPDVPKGFLAVYVGEELRRFIIPTSYLSHHLFKVLLEKSAEEFGFEQHGALNIPCEIETFKFLLKCIENQLKEKSSDAHEYEEEDPENGIKE
ncbi:hypothetical protein MLD38_006970 [Melastoma candidum]|uniref:Uncharacterized protein n=1 Tax=Melastoma candidum TaxID=119954 RepID=A0ACB9RTD5_9MYRT|nr:hypothetical protein MLD38_006970 [Melastoma candidum]